MGGSRPVQLLVHALGSKQASINWPKLVEALAKEHELRVEDNRLRDIKKVCACRLTGTISVDPLVRQRAFPDAVARLMPKAAMQKLHARAPAPASA